MTVRRKTISFDVSAHFYPPELPMDMMSKHITNSMPKPKHFDDDRFLGVYAVGDNEIHNLMQCVNDGKVVWDKPDGDWIVCVIGLSRNCGPHRNYINIMDRDSCKLLIDNVYEPHYKRYAADFGKTIAGFFSDEPELGNGVLYMQYNLMGTMQDLPWSAELEGSLMKSWGDNWILKLPLLWYSTSDEKEAASARHTYMDVVSRLIQKNFSEQVSDWCRSHGVEYIGHVIEDEGQHCRTASSLGHYFRGMWGQDMAGIDDIGGQVIPSGEDEPKTGFMGRKRNGEFYHYGFATLAASAAVIEPRKKGRAMCEIFAAYVWKCGVRMQKYLADHFLVRGINYFVPHAFSLKPYPDPDCPPHFYAHGHNPQYRHFG
jgi:hypothetical protein